MCFAVQISNTHSQSCQHNLACLLTHLLENEERVEKPHNGKQTTKGVTLKLKLYYHINSCITASCLPLHHKKGERSSLCSGLNVLPDGMCVCVCALMDFECCSFSFICVHSFYTKIHQ